MNISRFLPFRCISKSNYEKFQHAAEREAELLVKLDGVQSEFLVIAKELDSVKKAVKQKRLPIDPRVGDPSPLDSEQRVLYVAQVAGLHKDILEPKLRQMISSLYQLLEEASNDREYDQAIKGAIYFAWELIGWGNRMVSEQVAIQRGEHPSLSEDINSKE